MTVVYMWISLWILWISSKKATKNRQLFLLDIMIWICKLDCISTGLVNGILTESYMRKAT